MLRAARCNRMPAMLIKVSLLVLALGAVTAQETRSTIVGRVTDASGAVVAGAAVNARNTATGVNAAAKTNESGNFTLPYLLPGPYRIQAELQGFKKFSRDGIELRVNESVEVNISLEIGATTETVEVKADTPLLQTVDASLGQVVDQRRIQELPSFGSSPMTLVQLAPGVINSTDMRLAKAGSFSINKNSQFSTDGAGQYNNEFTLDGVSNTQAQGTSGRVGFIPPQTAVGEFKVQTAAFDASVGHTIGSLVNVSTKSGTNSLHGELYWWLRNSALDAPNIFQNRAGQKLPVYQDNRWGGWASGPIVKNKTFWFYNYEANKFGVPQSFVNTVPTDRMRRGDLGELRALGTNYQVYDPLSTVPAPNGRFSRTPIANNLIPASRLDAVAVNMLKFWPEPNQTGTTEGRNNHFRTTNALEETWVHLMRVDHSFSENHRAFVRLSTDFWQEDKNRVFTTGANGIILNRQNKGLTLDDVYVFNPTFLMNVRYGLTYANFTEKHISQGFDLASLGFSPRLAGSVQKDLARFPNVTVGSFTQLANWEAGDGGNYSTVHSTGATFTKMTGSHSIRFGVDYRVYRENQGRFPLDVAPQLAFGSTYTRGPLDSAAPPQLGGELASFLLGVPDGSMTRTALMAEQDKWFGAFVHDDWKVTRKLVVNLGLRYEMEAPVTERYDRSVATFAFDPASPIEAAARANYTVPIAELPASQFRVLGGLTYVGQGGNPRGYWRGERNNFMPRFGLAYQLSSKTVLRTGYGLFFDTLGVNKTDSIATGFSQSTPIQASLDNGLTFIASTANPFPNGLIAPSGSSRGLSTNLGQAISYFEPVRKQAYTQRFSFGFQRELPMQWLAEANYVGSRGTRIGINQNMNNTPVQYLSKSGSRDQATIDYLGAQSLNPLFGTNAIYGRNTSRANLLRPYPQFGAVTVNVPTGYSWYHALQTRLERRFSRGYTLMLAYTWSKTMEAIEYLNAADTVPYESLSNFDRPHRLVVSGIWELPVGRGRHWGSALPKAAEFVAGGWQLNGVMQMQSGAPLAFGDVWTLFTGDTKSINLPASERSVDRWFNTAAGFNRNNAQALASNYRVSALRFSGIRGDGQSRWDLSAIKNFAVTERWKVQFRAECLNAMNHPNLFAPNTTPTNTAFGTITGQDVPRSWQMALRITF